MKPQVKNMKNNKMIEVMKDFDSYWRSYLSKPKLDENLIVEANTKLDKIFEEMGVEEKKSMATIFNFQEIKFTKNPIKLSEFNNLIGDIVCNKTGYSNKSLFKKKK